MKPNLTDEYWPTKEEVSALPVKTILTLFAASGMCALIYELVWTRWLGLLLGNFATATATVVSIFMAGLAIGNLISGSISRRKSPRDSLFIYSLLEISIAFLAAISPLLLSSSSPIFPIISSLSSSPVLRAMICAIILLPPTILMGATLPFLIQALNSTTPRTLGSLYAFNTLGGAIGPFLAAFILMPTFGMRLTVWITSTFNLAVAIIAFLIAKNTLATTGTAQPGSAIIMPTETHPWPSWIIYAFAAASGFVALVFEVALTRLFILTITGSSVYGLAIILSAYLLGLALGAFILRLWPPRNSRQALFAFAVTQVIVWFFALATTFWDIIPPLLVHVWWNILPFYRLSAFNFLVVFIILLVFTTSSGYALPALSSALPNSTSTTIGRLFSANTAGAILGSLGAGFIFLPSWGLTHSLIFSGQVSLISAGFAGWIVLPRHRRAILVGIPFLFGLLLFLHKPDQSILDSGMYNRPLAFKPSFNFGTASPVDSAHNLGKVIYEKDSLTARITVRAVSGNGEMTFIVNGKPDGSNSQIDLCTQIFVAHIAAITHPNPKRALVIGLGTGITAGSMALHQGIGEIHVVENEPADMDVAELFRTQNNDVIHNPRVTIHLDDARHFLATDRSRYDIIVSEPSNLFVSGMASLFTAEFYKSVGEHLNPGGLFLQWIHYYRVAPDEFPGTLATLQTSFPNVYFWFHEYGDAFLLASRESLVIHLEQLISRINSPSIAQDLARAGVSPPKAILGFLLWGPHDTEVYARHARICTDDNPFFEFSTPLMPAIPTNFAELCMNFKMFGPLKPLPFQPESAKTRRMIGDLELERRNFSRALAEYQRAWDLDPGSSSLAMMCARIQHSLPGQDESALLTLKALLKRHPKNQEARIMLRDIQTKLRTN